MAAPPADERLAAYREALLEQLGYLIAEAEALQSVLASFPAEVLDARPAGKWSVKQTLGHLVDCDADVFLPRLERMVEGGEPAFDHIDQDRLVEEHAWNDLPVHDILTRIRTARAELLNFLEQLAPEAWTRAGVFPDGERRDVYALAHHVTQHDAHHLRALADRLGAGGR